MFRCISQYISLYSGLQGVQCSHKQKLCDSVVLGILVQKLKEHQLPIDSDATIYHSMEQIRDILAEIKPRVLYDEIEREEKKTTCINSPVTVAYNLLELGRREKRKKKYPAATFPWVAAAALSNRISYCFYHRALFLPSRNHYPAST